jgi:hypothetical protein
MCPAQRTSATAHTHRSPLGARRLILCVIGFTLAAAPGTGLLAEPASERASAVEHFLTSREQPLRQYRAYRRMHAWSERFNQEAWLEAWTELDHGRFRYEIVSESGSDRIRTKVLRSMLEHEQELVNSGDAGKADITPANYEFEGAGRDADGTQYVQLKPRRKDVLLVDGRMVISPDGADLLRVEGRLSKNPSFWTSLVNVVRRYARIGGVRVPVSTESMAKVKFAGTGQLEVFYEYESINGRQVRPQRLDARRR